MSSSPRQPGQPASYVVDRQRRIRYWSPSAVDVTGFTEQEVLGRSCADGILRHVSGQGVQLCVHGCPLSGVMADGVPRNVQAYLHHKDGHRVPVQIYSEAIRNAAGEIVGSAETFIELPSAAQPPHSARSRVTEARTDPETGVATTDYGRERLHAMLAAAAAGLRGVGVLGVLVDPDPSGAPASDQAWPMVARTVAHAVPPDVVVAADGPDRLLVLLPGADAGTPAAAAERIRTLVRHSWRGGPGDRESVTVSVGATLAFSGEPIEIVLARVFALAVAAGGNAVACDVAAVDDQSSPPVPAADQSSPPGPVTDDGTASGQPLPQ